MLEDRGFKNMLPGAENIESAIFTYESFGSASLDECVAFLLDVRCPVSNYIGQKI